MGWIEKMLLVAGLAALDVWLVSNADQAIYQAWQARRFDQELRGRTATVSVPPRVEDSDHAIPRLRLSAMVLQGVGEDTLRVALGHIPATALPGQPGNVGIAGHRDTLFRPLRLVHKNDLIVLETQSGKYVYRVQSTKVVGPRDVSVLNSKSSPELTLVTCYPFYYVGSAPERFVVEARQEPGEQAQRTAGY
jgi:sortase A